VHNNFFFLRRLVRELQPELIGKELTACFTQQKDELVLGFSNSKQEFWINAVLRSDFSCLYFPEKFNRAKKNSVDLFSKATGKQVVGVAVISFDRSFVISLSEGYFLLFKLHGNRSNIILLHQQNVVAVFKNNLKNDIKLRIDSLEKEVKLDKESFIQCGGVLSKISPTFGEIPAKWLAAHNYPNLRSEEQWNLFLKLLEYLEKGAFFILQEEKIKFSLLPFKTQISSVQSPVKAVNKFFITYSREGNLLERKNGVVKALHSEIKQAQKYLRNTRSNFDKLKKRIPPQEIADVLMAHLHQIEKGATSVELPNLYRNDEPMIIKLNAALSPQKNAEHYYRKSKNKEIEFEKIGDNISATEQRLERLHKELKKVEDAKDAEQIDLLYKQWVEKSTRRKGDKKQVPYKSFDFEGYKIWIGKNAKANDTLTLKYARKNDLWLHAKDVSGSHVVIKEIPGRKFSSTVKEKAAAWAAFYSKRKSDSLAPVICTFKKYVRKPKGMVAGAVIVDKEEEVLLVVPEQP
jgi:predicted ribosome quality control (RQC) complex YloA/Tae2 family protein